MRKIILIILLASCPIINGQWIQQYTTQSAIRDIRFINSQTGWACGDNIIYKTTNAGTNWVIQPNPTGNLIQQIHPANSMVAYADGWFQTILKTTNGGENWLAIRNGDVGDAVFEGLYFINQNTGWLCGNQFILKTTNGGESFDSVRVPSYLFDMHFRNANEGIVCGEVLSFYRTTNGGANWVKTIIVGQAGHNFYRMSVVNDTIVYLVGHGNQVFRSSNYGISFDSITYINNPFREIYCSYFPSNDTGYAGGSYGKFFKTTDGGHNWKLENTTSFTGYIASAYFLNNTSGWLVGNGRIMGTTTGGQTPILTNSTPIPNSILLHQNYPNPFNPATVISYQLPAAGFVTLNIYDVNGKLIKELVNEKQNAGSYEVNFDGSELPSGTYVYRITAGEFTETRKMVLVK